MNFTEINSYLEKISNSEVILSNFNSVSFEGLQNYISDKKNIRLINKFFEAIDLKVNGRIFLSSFMIYLHTNDVMMNSKDDELFLLSEKVIKLYGEILDKFSMGKIEEFKEVVTKYSYKFLNWKTKDLNKLVDNYIKVYWQIEMTILSCKENKDFTDEHIVPFREKQEDIKKTIMRIAGEKGMERFENYKPVLMDEKKLEKIQEQIASNYKKAYWDILKDDIDKKNYEGLIKILAEVRSRIAKLVPNRQDIHNSLLEFMDLEFIKQLLDESVMDNSQIYNLVHYIIDRLKELEAPADNELTEQWRNEINQIFQTKFEFSDFLPVYFQKVFDKLEKIEKEVKLVKESELYNVIKENVKNK